MSDSKSIGNSFEKIIIKDTGGKPSPGSGSIPGKKYDVTDASGRLFIECKSRKRPSSRGLKVELKWIAKLMSDYYRDMKPEKIPALAVTASNDQRDYVVLVYGQGVIENRELLDVRLYGWPEEDMAVPHTVAENAKSFAIKKPKSPGFYNVVMVPIKGKLYDFWLYDRVAFRKLVEALNAKHS